MAIKLKDRIMAAAQAARSAYKKGSFNQEIDFTEDSNWSDYKGRVLRYAVLEQYIKGNPYDKDFAKWANKYKADHGLYEHIRPIANPAKQLVKFHKSHIWGGWIDPEAGDGVDSAFPIITEHDYLRPYIAMLWKWSNWSIRRNDVIRDGVGLGDAFIQVIDDTDANKVYLKPIHPSKVEDIVKDPYGNVREYKISYMRTDDKEGSTNEVLYTETAVRDGDDVIYRLFKNGNPHPWHGAELPSVWSESYGFIPMVHIEHISTPYGWGESEMHGNMPLFREVDDQHSLLNDQIRKTINAVQIVRGESAQTFSGSQFSDPTSQRPQSMREEIPMLFLQNPESSMDPMVSDLSIDAVINNIEKLEGRLEDEYPELSLKRIKELGQVSGTAVRRLQQPAARKVDEYRGQYDGALVNAMQMALSIGGMRKLFKGIDLNSYKSGGLDFSIGKRPVFATDPADDLEIKKGQSEVLVNMSNVGNMGAAIDYIYGPDSPLSGKLDQVDTNIER